MNTTVTVSLPEDIASHLAAGEDLSRVTLEALALEGYRAEKLSTAEVRRMLNFQSRWEVDAFLNQHGVEAEYSRADLERDRETHRQLGL
ncbi:MAG: UPF0175 family protein [Acidobacteriota bacterium]|nr:UPF0175 family protein [Acidobacteriota bacterium]